MIREPIDVGDPSHEEEGKKIFLSGILPFFIIFIFSMVLNLWGNRWGLPDYWHPDEGIKRSLRMVEERSLNPHFFAYGGLHDYVLAIGAVIPTKAYAKFFDPIPAQGEVGMDLWRSRQITRMGVLSRSISGVVSSLLVCITVFISMLLFQDNIVGYVAGSFLCVSMYFVSIAHFATVDATANFLYWLSCVLALYYWVRGKMSTLLAASFVAGLAFGTKIDRSLVVIPLLLAYSFSGHGTKTMKELVSILMLMIFGFLLANPTIIISPFEYIDGFTRDLFFNALRRDYWSANPHAALLQAFRDGLGTPLFVLILCTSIYGGYQMGKHHGWKTIVWFFSTFIPAMIVLYTTEFLKIWYVVFFFPPLLIITVYGCIDSIRRLKGFYRLPAVLAMVSIWILTAFHTFNVLSQFTHDARYRAAAWIEANIPHRSKIVFSGDLMDLPNSNYDINHIRSLEFTPFLLSDLKRLDENKEYRAVRDTILRLEHWAGKHLGSSVRNQPYRAWFDGFSNTANKETNRNLRDLVENNEGIDYLVSVGNANSRKILNTPEYMKRYRLSVEFTTTPMFSFVNPTVTIFQNIRMDRSGKRPDSIRGRQ